MEGAQNFKFEALTVAKRLVSMLMFGKPWEVSTQMRMLWPIYVLVEWALSCLARGCSAAVANGCPGSTQVIMVAP